MIFPDDPVAACCNAMLQICTWYFLMIWSSGKLLLLVLGWSSCYFSCCVLKCAWVMQCCKVVSDISGWSSGKLLPLVLRFFSHCVLSHCFQIFCCVMGPTIPEDPTPLCWHWFSGDVIWGTQKWHGRSMLGLQRLQMRSGAKSLGIQMLARRLGCTSDVLEAEAALEQVLAAGAKFDLLRPWV